MPNNQLTTKAKERTFLDWILSTTKHLEELRKYSYEYDLAFQSYASLLVTLTTNRKGN